MSELDPKIKELFEDIELVAPFLENTWSVGKTQKNNTMSVDEIWRACKRLIAKYLRPDEENKGEMGELFAKLRARQEEDLRCG
tara:strand:- start:978 stop:1226 length:249 start_codon:yes stop_codon:yes gene_type:complete